MKPTLLKARAWTPLDLTGLVTWLPMDAGAGAGIQTVRDLAPGGGGAVRGTGVPSAADPTWTQHGLSFDGGDYATADADPIVVNGNHTIIAVVNAVNVAGNKVVYAESNAINDDRFVFYVSQTQVFGFYRIGGVLLQSNKLFTSGSWSSIAVSCSAWVATMYTNCVAGFPTAVSDLSASTATMLTYGSDRYGPTPTFGSQFRGSIAAVFRIGVALNTAEIVTVHNYLARTLRTRGVSLTYV